MYDVALSVAACARAGTRADVAWLIAPTATNDALAFTPGGGRIGGLAGGAFDGLLADVAARQLPRGRRVRHRVEDWEAPSSGFTVGTDIEFLVVPAEQFPQQVWGALLEREPVLITAYLEGDDVTEIEIATVQTATQDDARALQAVKPSSDVDVDRVRTVLTPGTTLVVAGAGPMADALSAQAELLGWNVAVDPRPEMVAGLTAALGGDDAVVVMGHDVESSSRCLQLALESGAGYVGALGSLAMQRSRADWLAYRDVIDLSRVHGPAGLDIGAATPEEIAVSIVAEIVGNRVSS